MSHEQELSEILYSLLTKIENNMRAPLSSISAFWRENHVTIERAKAALTRPTTDATTPFSLRDLSVLHYANGFTLWHYKTTKIDDVCIPHYFSNAAARITNGDHIHVSATDGGMILHVVSADVAKGVTVEKMAG